MPRDVGGWAKKNTHQVFGLERLHKVSVWWGRGVGARHVYNKRQVIAVELCTLKTLECATQFYFVLYQKLFSIQFLSISVFITMLTCLAINNYIST